jgi:SagB-type dehydrogenase family enzyme
MCLLGSIGGLGRPSQSMIQRVAVISASWEIILAMISEGMIMAHASPSGYERADIVPLPQPHYEGKLSVESALHQRKSVRAYTDAPLTIAEVSQLLWAAQGITHADGLRTAPSAGALYLLTVYLVVANVQMLSQGIYTYQRQKHKLVRVIEGNKRAELSAAALEQSWVQESAVVMVLSAIYERTTARYGERGIRYVHMEVGHAAQNIQLQAVSLNLGTVVVGAFDDRKVQRIMQMTTREVPLSLMPVGRIS